MRTSLNDGGEVFALSPPMTVVANVRVFATFRDWPVFDSREPAATIGIREDAAIRAEGLRKSYGGKVKALDGVDLAIAAAMLAVCSALRSHGFRRSLA
jgi:hypothetical protein